MVKKVVKSDRSIISFSRARIERSIEKAAKDAKLGSKEISKLATKVSGAVVRSLKGVKVTTHEIGKKVLAELDKVAPDVSAEWRKFVKRNN